MALQQRSASSSCALASGSRGVRAQQLLRPVVRSRVAFTRAEAALEEVPVHSASASKLSSGAKAAVVLREPSPDSVPVDAAGAAQPMATMSVDAEQLQQLLLDEYKRGFEAGAAASREATPEKILVHDSVQRTAAKSFTWRVLSTATTVTLALVLFNDSIAADAAMELGVVEFLSKYGLYFLHERAWAGITFLL